MDKTKEELFVAAIKLNHLLKDVTKERIRAHEATRTLNKPQNKNNRNLRGVLYIVLRNLFPLSPICRLFILTMKDSYN